MLTEVASTIQAKAAPNTAETSYHGNGANLHGCAYKIHSSSASQPERAVRIAVLVCYVGRQRPACLWLDMRTGREAGGIGTGTTSGRVRPRARNLRPRTRRRNWTAIRTSLSKASSVYSLRLGSRPRLRPREGVYCTGICSLLLLRPPKRRPHITPLSNRCSSSRRNRRPRRACLRGWRHRRWRNGIQRIRFLGRLRVLPRC